MARVCVRVAVLEKVRGSPVCIYLCTFTLCRFAIGVIGDGKSKQCTSIPQTKICARALT